MKRKTIFFVLFFALFIYVFPLKLLARASDNITFQADRVEYDDLSQKLILEGNVSIFYKDFILNCEKLEYFRSENRLSIEAEIAIINRKGDIIFARLAELNDEFTMGIMSGIGYLFSDKSKLSSSKGYLTENKQWVFESATYSPCKTCDHIGNLIKPVWRLKSSRTIYDQEQEQIYYYDVKGEFLNVPVFYWPYFSHPSPKVKRKTGFLVPNYKQSQTLGGVIQIPFYWVIDDYSDLTFIPWITSDEGLVLQGEYRQNFKNGHIKAKGAITHDKTLSNDYRGYLDADLRYALSKSLLVGADIEWQSDDTFRRRYDIDDETQKVSKIFLESLTQDFYAIGELINFYNLRQSDISNFDVNVYPNLMIHSHGQESYFKGIYDFEIGARQIEKDFVTESDSFRAHMKAYWKRKFSLPQGQILTIKGSTKNEVYHIENALNSDHFNETFLHAQFDMVWQYPLVKQTDSASYLVEPIAGFILSPMGKARRNVPDDDSRAFIISEANIFDSYRLPGYDRHEFGSRLYYGFKSQIDLKENQRAYFFLGQSLQLAEDPIFYGPDIEVKGMSDLVGRIALDYSNQFIFDGRFNYNFEEGILNRVEILSTYTDHSYQIYGKYLYFRKISFGPDLENEPEELTLGGSFQIADYWSTYAEIKYDFENDFFPRNQIGLKYKDECFGFSINLMKENLKDRDFEPGYSVNFTISLKNIGDYSSSFDPSSTLLTKL